MNETYELLRNLTTPIVALTTRTGDKVNGMIANSAMRASLSPEKPRVSVYVHKFNYSHDLIFESGRFVMHILDADQFDIVYRLGFSSGREAAKLDGIPYTEGLAGLPILDGVVGYFQCRVANVMDTGPSTLFFGAVEHAARGTGTEVLSPDILRRGMSEEYRRMYVANLEEAQRAATRMADDIRPLVWRDLK